MGVVYGVVNEAGVEGAMKVMLPSLARAPEAVARFLQEARLLVALRHPNIVRVIDFDRLTDGTPFVVMERLKGRTLGTALRALRESGGLTPSLAYEIIRQLCEGLHFAHSHDPPIVHRDVKPENVFVHRTSADTVLIKLIDFGIAAVIDDTELALALGTPRYMAPELLRGEPASPQSDIYSAALLLYQMLTDRFPWNGDIHSGPEMASAHLGLEPAPPSRYCPWIPAAVDECILQALSKDPRARPSNAHDFSASLCVLQFVNDRRSTSDIDLDSTPLTRERDLLDLAALAGVIESPVRPGRDAEEQASPDLVTTAVPRKPLRRSFATGTLSLVVVLVSSAGAVALARSVALRLEPPASSAPQGSVLPEAAPAMTPVARRQATPSASAESAPHGGAIVAARPRMRSERIADGGERTAEASISLPVAISVPAPISIPTPVPVPALDPIEKGELPFLPESP